MVCGAAMGRSDPTPRDENNHSHDTLKVWSGTVVGANGDDIFVELGPRMQGVISLREFDEAPVPGEVFDFTLRGREQGLWILERKEAKALSTWENLEAGSLVHARVTGTNHGGLELKIGPLHAFMPKSQTGLPREQKASVFVGRTITCEVIEIDTERQRVVVSRKLVLKRERESRLQRLVGSLRPGQSVQGRVTRIEPYGAFVSFGQGLEGLIHISNLSIERVEHPCEVVKKGDHLEVKVLNIKQGGKRIGLGLKQMQASPWEDIEHYLAIGQIVDGKLTRVEPYGVFVEVAKGVEGLVHVSQMEIGAQRQPREVASVGTRFSVRVLALDPENERLSLSLLHSNGARIDPEEAANESFFSDIRAVDDLSHDKLGINLGSLVRRALQEPDLDGTDPQAEQS